MLKINYSILNKNKKPKEQKKNKNKKIRRLQLIKIIMKRIRMFHVKFVLNFIQKVRAENRGFNAKDDKYETDDLI